MEGFWTRMVVSISRPTETEIECNLDKYFVGRGLSLRVLIHLSTVLVCHGWAFSYRISRSGDRIFLRNSASLSPHFSRTAQCRKRQDRNQV